MCDEEDVFKPTNSYSKLYNLGFEDTDTLGEAVERTPNNSWYMLNIAQTYGGVGYSETTQTQGSKGKGEDKGKGKSQPKAPFSDHSLDLCVCVKCQSMAETEANPIIFCDLCSTSMHLQCVPSGMNQPPSSKTKQKLATDPFTCDWCNKQTVEEEPIGLQNVGMPSAPQDLARHLRNHTRVMQRLSMYRSPWYENGAPFKWNKNQLGTYHQELGEGPTSTRACNPAHNPPHTHNVLIIAINHICLSAATEDS
jgi:hypothetical protein